MHMGRRTGIAVAGAVLPSLLWLNSATIHKGLAGANQTRDGLDSGFATITWASFRRRADPPAIGIQTWLCQYLAHDLASPQSGREVLQYVGFARW